MNDYVHYYVNGSGLLDPEMAAAFACLEITGGVRRLSVGVEASDERDDAMDEVAVTEGMAREARKAREALSRLWEMIRPPANKRVAGR